jgi:hypothetical protein
MVSKKNVNLEIALLGYGHAFQTEATLIEQRAVKVIRHRREILFFHSRPVRLFSLPRI